MTPLRDRRSRPLGGRIEVPGDKSLSHRALLLAALAEGRSTIAGLNSGDDVARTLLSVGALGAGVAYEDLTHLVKVEGWGERGPSEPAGVIDAGNSGTTARVVLGPIAAMDGIATITGDASLRRRPMLRVVAPLRSMGATIDGREHGDRLPLTIRGARLQGMDHELRVASAQVKSALLLAGLSAQGATSVTEPGLSRDHTENMLRAAGVDVRSRGRTVSVTGGQRPVPMDWDIPGDISSAMFLVVAAALLPGSDLTVSHVGLNQTRTRGLDFLKMMGADLNTTVTGTACGEPVGDVRIRSSQLTGTTVTSDRVPSLIDEIPILAVAASQAEGTTVFEGVGELRAKESDRVAAIADGLTGLGGHVDVDGDRLSIHGPTRLTGGVADSHGDHRMAMSFAIAGLVSEASIRVQGWKCVETSFPSFLDVLAQAQGGGK